MRTKTAVETGPLGFIAEEEGGGAVLSLRDSNWFRRANSVD